MNPQGVRRVLLTSSQPTTKTVARQQYRQHDVARTVKRMGSTITAAGSSWPLVASHSSNTSSSSQLVHASALQRPETTTLQVASFSGLAAAPASSSSSSSSAAAAASATAPTSTSSSSITTVPIPPVDVLIQNVHKASKYNQGNTRDILSNRKVRREFYWDVDFCRDTANAYEHYLMGLANINSKNNSNNNKQPIPLLSSDERTALLATSVVDRALGLLLKCQLKPNKLADKVRDWERALGTLGETPLTATFSLRLVEVNGKAGNVGRVLSLLDYRAAQLYKPRYAEFRFAVTAVEVAGWHLRHNRNIFMSDVDQPQVDNPTRWLDAILLNMQARQFPLTTHLAARMMDTFASRGRSGKATHYFYSVHRTPINNSSSSYGIAYHEEGDDEDDGHVLDFDEESNEHDAPLLSSRSNLPGSQTRPYKVRLKLKTPPPHYKIPTEVAGKLLPVRPKKSKSGKKPKTVKRSAQAPAKQPGILKIDRETEPDWSLPLTAAFSFADSLSHGACGHDPMELDLVCYNILIKTCVYRGALWRAMHVLDTVMPAAGVTPDHRSYDTILSGLSRVGDVTLMRSYYQQMISSHDNDDGTKKKLEPSHYTVKYIVDGLLNLGDVAGAITVIQDFFNQHNILPPITTQLKVLEFALGLDMIYEAKRHMYFIQQIWKWEPHYKYESKDFIYYMKAYQRDQRLSKEALQDLFSYFGETLDESDFF